MCAITCVLFGSSCVRFFVKIETKLPRNVPYLRHGCLAFLPRTWALIVLHDLVCHSHADGAHTDGMKITRVKSSLCWLEADATSNLIRTKH